MRNLFECFALDKNWQITKEGFKAKMEQHLAKMNIVIGTIKYTCGTMTPGDSNKFDQFKKYQPNLKWHKCQQTTSFTHQREIKDGNVQYAAQNCHVNVYESVKEDCLQMHLTEENWSGAVYGIGDWPIDKLAQIFAAPGEDNKMSFEIEIKH